jgi:hypothetical protein
MRCEDAAAFVSALYDGEEIPREVAEHLGACEACAARLASYSAIGAELRRAACLSEPMDLKPGAWEKSRPAQSSWWRKGRESISIPRFAFVSMLAAIVLLSGGLVMVRARANAGGPVLWLAAKLPPEGKALHAAIRTDGPPGRDGFANFQLLPSGGVLSMSVHFLRREGDRVQLGVKVLYEDPVSRVSGNANDRLNGVAEQSLWIEPGKNAEISVPGLGSVEFAGDFIDHEPPSFFSPEDTVDPRPNEFRVVSPVLIRGKELVFNMARATSSVPTGSGTGVFVYWPGEGRFLFSSAPFKGAVRGTVFSSQVKFTVDGQDYLLLTAVPVTRAAEVWVRLESNYKPSEWTPDMSDHGGVLGSGNPSDFPQQ